MNKNPLELYYIQQVPEEKMCVIIWEMSGCQDKNVLM